MNGVQKLLRVSVSLWWDSKTAGGAAEQQRAFARVACQGRRALEFEARFVQAVQLGKEIRAYARQQVIAFEGRLCEESVSQIETRFRPVGHADRHRAIQFHHRRWREGGEHGVKR